MADYLTDEEQSARLKAWWDENGLMMVAAVVLSISAFVGWRWAALVVATSCVYAALWSIIHSAHHDLRFRWCERVPGYRYWRDHHLTHHAKPNCNFGTVFPWTDLFFGTRG